MRKNLLGMVPENGGNEKKRKKENGGNERKGCTEERQV